MVTKLAAVCVDQQPMGAVALVVGVGLAVFMIGRGAVKSALHSVMIISVTLQFVEGDVALHLMTIVLPAAVPISYVPNQNV